jgi:DNA-binding transcriptional LysR family regulator
MTEKKSENIKLGVDTNDRVRAFRRIDLNLFVVFATIYEYRSLTTASYHLGLTQPAVSHSLARLREALNDRLFVRKGGVSVPTPFAHAIIDDVHKALEIIRSGPLGQQVFDPSTSTKNFRISMDSAMEAFLLPDLIQRMSRIAPGITITSTRVQRRDVETELARSDLSMALDIDFPFGQEIKRRTLGNDFPIVVGRKGNPLLKNGLSREAFLEGKHVIVTTRKAGVALDDYELAKQGYQRKITVRCSTLMVGLQIVANTDYLMSLGQEQLGVISPDDRLQVFDYPFEIPNVKTMLFWHENVNEEPGNVWMRELISKTLQQK